jgi:hypothetical protein
MMHTGTIFEAGGGGKAMIAEAPDQELDQLGQSEQYGPGPGGIALPQLVEVCADGKTRSSNLENNLALQDDAMGGATDPNSAFLLAPGALISHLRDPRFGSEDFTKPYKKSRDILVVSADMSLRGMNIPGLSDEQPETPDVLRLGGWQTQALDRRLTPEEERNMIKRLELRAVRLPRSLIIVEKGTFGEGGNNPQEPVVLAPTRPQLEGTPR